MAAVHHVFVGQFNSAIEPCAPGWLAIADRVDQPLTVVQDVRRTKGVCKGLLCLIQTGLVHLRADIAALGGVGLIHGCGVQMVLRDDHDMVLGARRVAGVQPVVKARDQVVYVADRPVVAQIQILKRACADLRGLCRRQTAAQILATERGVMRACAVGHHNAEHGVLRHIRVYDAQIRQDLCQRCALGAVALHKQLIRLGYSACNRKLCDRNTSVACHKVTSLGKLYFSGSEKCGSVRSAQKGTIGQGDMVLNLSGDQHIV